MNREAILAVIDDELRKLNADSEAMRPLHEVAQNARDRIIERDSSADQALRSGVESPSVVPIGLVSEFADQSLSSELNERVCHAAKTDLSVLMELVAARRSRLSSPSTLPPINAGLQQRLKQMSSEAFATAPAQTPPIALPAQTKNSTRQVSVIAMVVATAAIISGIVFLLSGKSDSEPGQMQIVREDRSSVAQPLQVDDPGKVTQDNAPQKLAAGSNDPPKSNIDEQKMDVSAERSLRGQNPQPRDTVSDTLVPPNESIAMPSERSIDSNNDPGSASDPNSYDDVGEPKFVDAISNFRWTQITGLVATRIVDPQRDPSYQSPWLSVVKDSPSDSERPFRVPVDLITLPSSRAEASIGGSKIGLGRSSFVIGSDSHCRVSAPNNASNSNVAQIKLLHGAIAMRRVTTGSVVEIVGSGQQRLLVKWLSSASMVVQYGEHGLETHLDQGIVSINGQRRTNESMAWPANGETISIPQPARLPVWTDRPVDSIRLPPAVLSQLRSSNNLQSDFSQAIGRRDASGSLNANDLSILARCQAAMNDQQLLRLASATVPQQRQAALERLFGIPSWDPRYEPIWKAAGRRIRNDRQLQRLQALGQMAQTGNQPNATQTERLLAGLTASNITIRSISDFLLRTFARGGPPYDPAWTGTAQIRSVALWRKYLGR